MARRSWAGWAIALGAVLLLAGGLSLAARGALSRPAPEAGTRAAPTPSSAAQAPRADPTLPRPTPTPSLVERLARNPMRERDDVALVSSLGGGPIPRVVRTSPFETQLGDARRLWIGDLEGVGRNYQITATLRLQTPHVEMWVEEGVEVAQDALSGSAAAFEQRIHPTNRRYFGSEWTPGVDGNPRLLVLNARFSGAAGYFSLANEYSHLVNRYSNESEMLVMNLAVLQPGAPGYDAVLAHEYQHMIHWRQDPNEEAWVNEGCSELAEDLNGYEGPRGATQAYGNRPATQLNTWSDEARSAHYSASFLFMRYTLDRLGPEMLRALLQEPASGIAGFDAVLARRGLSGQTITFGGLFADWLVANALDDPQLGDGRFGYAHTEVHVQRSAMDVGAGAISPTAVYTDTVPQYAARYVELLPAQAGPLRLSFAGSPTVRLAPNAPASGHWQWWSNRGDGSHASLQRAFDLRGVATATLAFSLWYDIESGWDYATLRASTDGGVHWRLLRGAHMSDDNPNGNALGPGYTGQSGQPAAGAPGAEDGPQWVRETLDLRDYCGQEVLIRFDYVTDDAVNGPGLCLDDLELAAIGYADDVEAAESEDPSRGGWLAEGFIRSDNLLPQGYLLQLIEFTPEPRVTRLEVNAEGQGEWPLDGCPGAPCRAPLLIISAIAPSTTEPAAFRLQLRRQTW